MSQRYHLPCSFIVGRSAPVVWDHPMSCQIFFNKDFISGQVFVCVFVFVIFFVVVSEEAQHHYHKRHSFLPCRPQCWVPSSNLHHHHYHRHCHQHNHRHQTNSFKDNRPFFVLASHRFDLFQIRFCFLGFHFVFVFSFAFIQRQCVGPGWPSRRSQILFISTKRPSHNFHHTGHLQ